MKNRFTIIQLLIVLILGFASPIYSQTVLLPSNDTYIRGGTYADNNYGAADELVVKIGDNESYMRKALLQFDLSSLSNVQQAILRLYANSAKTTTLNAYLLSDDWEEASVTWNTLPAIGSSILSADFESEGMYYEFDLTNIVTTEFEGDETLSIIFTDDAASNTTISFNSKEADSYLPQLVVLETDYDDFTSIPVSDDAKIFYWGSSKHTKNYGSDTDLSISYNGSVSKFCADSYLKFDISGETELKDTVLLKLYTAEFSRASSISIFGLATDESWSESTITGYDKPLATERIGIYVVNGLGRVTFDVADYYNKAITNNWQSLTLVIKENEGASISFNSDEAGENTPELLLGQVAGTYSGTTVSSGTFYIDAVNGNDNNSGTSETEPWQNLTMLSGMTLAPGSTIKLKSDSEWNRQQINFKGSGESGNPIRIEAYGTGERPKLNGGGISNGVILLFNQEYIEITGLEITNLGAKMDSLRRGIYILADNYGVVNHIEITDMYFTDINGTDGYVDGVYGNDDDEKRSGGIFMEIRGDDVHTYFDGVLIERCYFYYCSNNGFGNTSHWSVLSFDSDWDDNTVPGTSNDHYVHNFVPSKNMVFRRNRFEQTLSQGMIIRTAEDPLMEYNLFYFNSTSEGSDNACFNSKTTGAIWRYNESCYTQYTEGQGDGAGIDSDIRTKNTLIEYNYCHNNGYGGVIATGGRFETSFNDSTIIRYNILANNNHNSIRLCNQNTNALIFNNLVYYDDEVIGNRTIFQHLHSDTPLGPTDTYVTNNIFYNKHGNGHFTADVDWSDERVERCNYSNNLIYGLYEGDEYPDDENMITEDPLFVLDTLPEQEIGGYVLLDENGIPTGEINYSFLTGFRPQSTSPVIDMGVITENAPLPEFDFEFRTIETADEVVNMGPYEYDSTIVIIGLDSEIEKGFAQVYPNPAIEYLNLSSPDYTISKVTIINSTGQVVMTEQLSSKTHLVNVESLTNGIYFIQLESEETIIQTTKFMKQ